jgi:GGDEF domain-containing protein
LEARRDAGASRPDRLLRAWLIAAAVVLVFAGLLAYMWASLRHARRLEHANSRNLELAQTDLLTNLPNRRAFVKWLTMAFTACWRGAPPFAVLYLDIDDFKDVNDTLGHAMGDLLLKEVVNRLRSAVRPGDMVARFGGDELAIFLPNVTEPATRAIWRQGSASCSLRPSASRDTRSALLPASASRSTPPTLPAPKR